MGVQKSEVLVDGGVASGSTTPNRLQPRHIGDRKRASTHEMASPHGAEPDCNVKSLHCIAGTSAREGKRHWGEDEAASVVWYSIRRISTTATARRSACSAATSLSGSSLCVRWLGWLRGVRSINNGIHNYCCWLAVRARTSPRLLLHVDELDCQGQDHHAFMLYACHCNFSTLRSARLDRRLVH
jgi:hypothetical protein